MKKPIQVENVSKVYRLLGRDPTLYETLGSVTQALLRRGNHERPQIWALQDVSFTLDRGEVLGIIGPNGAGKTTILRLLAGVTSPTSGRVHVHGRVAPLIALGAGFHPELTGRENIYLNGIILGMTRQEIDRKFNAIVEFAELEGFLDTPVKRYSSGMYARLGFATAIYTEPDILLVDEVLAVGDWVFQEKCLARMENFKRQGVTIVFVSHNLDMVRRVCDRVILLEHGRISVDGDASEASSRYFQSVTASRIEVKPNEQKYAQIHDIELLDANEKRRTSFRSGETVYLNYKVQVCQDLENMEVGFAVNRSDGIQIVSAPGSALGGMVLRPLNGSIYEVTFRMRLNLLGGTYSVGIWVTDKGFARVYDWLVNATTITVADDYSHGGIADLNPVCMIVESNPSGGD